MSGHTHSWHCIIHIADVNDPHALAVCQCRWVRRMSGATQQASGSPEIIVTLHSLEDWRAATQGESLHLPTFE